MDSVDCEASSRLLDSTAMSDDESKSPPPHHDARMRLVWELLVLHLKLATEAIRDIFLSPVSIIAVIVGLIAGGDKPDLYFRRVQRFGRKSDLWINVFGVRHRGPSADEMRTADRRVVARANAPGRTLRAWRRTRESTAGCGQQEERGAAARRRPLTTAGAKRPTRSPSRQRFRSLRCADADCSARRCCPIHRARSD